MSLDLDPPPARVEPSQRQATAAILLALVGCSGLTIPVSAVLAVLVLRRSRRTGDDHGTGLAVSALLIDGLWVAVGLLLVVVVRHHNPVTRDESGRVTAAQSRSVFALEDGDCFSQDDSYVDDGTATELGNVTLLPCARPHRYQVVGVLDVPSPTYPGEDALRSRAEAGCAGASRAARQRHPSLGLVPASLYPQVDAWGDPSVRRILCIVGTPADATSSFS